ncbi:WD40/YVTN/BNR-like repeat-containing protein [Tautonia plasticadhaerens]|uniref:Ycf48-like protein n=1 Tax=Tautonia plasticadhaerens TaxID=2527974 RepID=A0A518H6B6_9BACT|nr:YCF48-related protein [Tautonia plasticadhaerens]QDV36384.1 Ycf48-like protein precursor [Tautonia plasticadhaerens]
MRFLAALLVVALYPVAAEAQWVSQDSGTTARLRGLSVVDGRVAWASGAGGTVLRTVDGGETWEHRIVPDAADLDFRDIEVFDDATALLLSIGEGDLSRIYRTTDGGETWTLRHVNTDDDGFLDALAFWDDRHGIAMGEPVGGRFVILTTDDGGETWDRIDPQGMPEALPGEGAFAASGTCLVVHGDRHAWFGTSGGRVFRSDDRGRTWAAHETPIRSDSPASGVFSLAFRDAEHGVAVGGDYERPDLGGRNVAVTSDGGRTWETPEGPGPAGYRSAVAFIPGTEGPTLVAVGPTGTDWSRDGGETWERLGDEGFHAVDFAGEDAGWAVGENGRITRFDAME